MSAISISLTPGKVFAPGERLTNDQLNLLGQPALQLQGSLGTAQLENQSVTTPILALGAVTAAQCAAGGFTADANGVAPFAAGFLATLYTAQMARPVAGRTKCIVTNNASNGNTKATITAAEVALTDASGNYYLATGVSLTVDITAAGASNGLDTLPGTGASASTWYYFYVIYNPGANTVQGLISASATSPTLPSGYTCFQLVGAVYNQSGSTGWLAFRVVNRRVYTVETVLFTAFAATTSWALYTTNVALAIPPIATALYGVLGTTASGGAGLAGDSSGTGAAYTAGASGTAIDTFAVGAAFAIPIITSQSVYVKGSGTSAICRAVCTGFEF